MRALCGAIITAGAMIALGLTAVGIGQRYSGERAFQTADPVNRLDATADPAVDPKPILVKLSWMDRPLIFILVFSTGVAVVGLGITILGLAYHHVRRTRELELERERALSPRIPV